MARDVKSRPPKSEGPDVARLERQIAELTEALQRERADSENIRRRHSEELAGLRTRAKAQVVKDLLPVVDNFVRALQHVPKDLESNDYVKGIRSIVKQFEDTLGKIGVERIKTVGEPFNPNLHDAVSMEEGEGKEEIVSEELQAGYCLGDDIIRHAVVRVKLQ
jgi:molecular chaperone GrpE